METKKRSLVKAATYRISSSVLTGCIVLVFTQKGKLALSIGLCDSVVKFVMYFVHERLWAKIPYGLLKHRPATAQDHNRVNGEQQSMATRKQTEMSNPTP